MTATVNRTVPTVPDFTDTRDDDGQIIATWSFYGPGGYDISGSMYASDDATCARLWECEPGDPSHGIGDEPVECWERPDVVSPWAYEGPWYGIDCGDIDASELHQFMN